MLTNHSANSVYDLADQLAQQGLRLSVIDESPITALLAACVSPSMASGQMTPVADDAVASNPVTNFIGASRLKGPEGASEHDLVMAELVETIAGTVTRNLAWARNEIVPMVSNIYDQAMKDIAEAAKRGPIPLVVLPLFYGALWDRPEIHEMVANYAHIPYRELRLSHVVGLPEGKTPVQVLDTGLSGVNSAIADLVARRGEAYVNSIYQCYFGVDHFSRLELTMSWETIDDAMVVMLLANALRQHVPEGLNVSLDGYKAYMAEIVEQAASAVGRLMQRREEYRANGRLVLELPPGSPRRGNIFVNGDVYNAWLQEAGASPETLMGAVLAGREVTYQALLADAAKNLQTYQSMSATLKTELQYDKYNAMLSSFRKSMSTLIEAMDEEAMVVPRSVLLQNLNFRLTHVKVGDLDNPYLAARKLLCRTLWHHTDVERYLLALDTAAEVHPGLDPRELGYFAALDVVTEWLQSQVTVVSGG